MLNNTTSRAARRLIKLIAVFTTVGLLAVGAMVCAVLLPQINSENLRMWIVLGSAIAVFVVYLIVVIACCSALSKLIKQPLASAPVNGVNAKGKREEVGDVDDVSVRFRTTYMQSDEEKLRQIDMMDKSQFVVYLSGLYSLKGYKVDIARVDERCGIDMIVSKNGEKTGVSCMLSKSMLINEHVNLVDNGKKENKLKNAVIITNSYFDQSAVAQAKTSKITLMDREGLVAFGRLA